MAAPDKLTATGMISWYGANELSDNYPHTPADTVSRFLLKKHPAAVESLLTCPDTSQHYGMEIK